MGGDCDTPDILPSTSVISDGGGEPLRQKIAATFDSLGALYDESKSLPYTTLQMRCIMFGCPNSAAPGSEPWLCENHQAEQKETASASSDRTEDRLTLAFTDRFSINFKEVVHLTPENVATLCRALNDSRLRWEPWNHVIFTEREQERLEAVEELRRSMESQSPSLLKERQRLWQLEIEERREKLNLQRVGEEEVKVNLSSKQIATLCGMVNYCQLRWSTQADSTAMTMDERQQFNSVRELAHSLVSQSSLVTEELQRQMWFGPPCYPIPCDYQPRCEYVTFPRCRRCGRHACDTGAA